MSERNGVEIDYCPQCRGVWLDRGELDKIIERSSSTGGSAPASQSYSDDNSSSHASHSQHSDHDDDQDSYDSHGNGHQPQNKRKKESFLGDLFDF
jgi:Zn-finger nucleic acid-binding protein